MRASRIEGMIVNFIFISPNFPHTYWQFCDRLRKNGVNVFGIGDAPYDILEESLKNSLIEYYKVPSLENYQDVYDAVKFFAEKYGKIDWIESNNEYWLEQDARLRSDFNIITGINIQEITSWKHKSFMNKIYKNAGIPVANQHSVTTLADAKDFISKVGYPVILKPDVGVGAANTWKIHNDFELEKFYNEKPDVPYVIEEFIVGNVCSYDAIVDSNSNPLFESMTVWPPSIADIVNKGLDLSYYTTTKMSEKLQILGRKALKAFNVKSRFVHLEFFCLTEPHKNIGEIGDFAALEVNMRPAGGYTPDMMNFAHSTDVYQIWADMITCDRRILPDCNKHSYCVYASRKNHHKYCHSHEEILKYYGNQIVMCECMPELMWETMGCQMYTALITDEKDVKTFIDFVHKKEL